MKLFGLNISRSQPEQKRSIDPNLNAWLKGENLEMDGTTLANAYEQVPWVYRAVTLLAEQVANAPFLFSAGDRGRENLITTGPLPAFYNHPNPTINRFEYWELRVMYLMLRGECFRVPVYNQRKLEKILILDPANFHHIIQDHTLIGWRYNGLGNQAPLESQIFLPSEVWFEKLPNPFNPWRGLAPLHAADMAARTDFAASSFMRGLIENNADLGIIVSTKDPISDEQEEQIIASLRNRKRKAGAPDRPLLLAGGAEVIKPQLSSSDLQFLENRKFSRAEICAAFGVPEELITATDHAKYDVMQGARLNFIENRVAPLCRRLEATEELTVKALDPKATGWFDIDSLPIMQEAQRNRLAAAKTGFDMGIPFNELNRVFDLGFKALPWGNNGYLPAKVQNVGSLTAESPKKSLTPEDPLHASKESIDQLKTLLHQITKSKQPR
jgi:HK97 family phage portal protein